MTVDSMATNPVAVPRRQADVHAIYGEGIRAGLIGAATIALWFLVLDAIAGRPLYTPNVLGTALLQGPAALDAPGGVPIALETVIVFTWMHVLAFLLIGVAAARLVALAETDANFGFGILLLFIVFEFGFLAVNVVLAEPVLRAIAWPAVLGGNLVAAATMAAVFWRRHPRLLISP
jgi:hypothetical protein